MLVSWLFCLFPTLGPCLFLSEFQMEMDIKMEKGFLQNFTLKFDLNPFEILDREEKSQCFYNFKTFLE